MGAERLQKILSHAGVSSRRAAEGLILEGRVAVNGKVVRELGSRADPETDEVMVDGVPVIRSRYRYVVLHKPRGVVSTARDTHGRTTVVDLVRDASDLQLHPVGRLDIESDGLLLLTNDGHLTELLTHPRHEVEKEYLVRLDRPLAKQDVERIVRGLDVDGERMRAHSATAVRPPGAADGEAWIRLVLREGKKREIRLMMEALDRRVFSLTRIRMGPLHLGKLAPGAWRDLTDDEVARLYEAGKASMQREAEAAKPDRRTRRKAERESAMAARYPIAIDGTAAAGKSSLAAALAKRYGLSVFDTGVTYRAFTLFAIERGVAAEDEEACVGLAKAMEMHVEGRDDPRVTVNGVDVTARLREPAVEGRVSDYSAIAGVRTVLIELQRRVALERPSVVVGRDIGTVVLPDAPVKLFLTASDEARAKRRAIQAGTWGQEQDAAAAAGDIQRRDGIDSTKGALRQAADAVAIDTTELSVDEVIEKAVEAVECEG